jgi:thioredoxin-like negative regulator of GroEL
MYSGAEAKIAIADGDLPRAAQRLRQSVRHWREVGCRVGEVDARLRLAQCLLQDRDIAGAELELHALEAGLAASAAPYRARIDALKDTLRQLQGAASA